MAETALAVSVSEVRKGRVSGQMDLDSSSGRELRLLSMRTVDPPSRLTPPGVPHVTNAGASGGVPEAAAVKQQSAEGNTAQGVWKAPLGGTKFGILDAIIQAVLEKGGVVDEVLDGLDGVDLA